MSLGWSEDAVPGGSVEGLRIICDECGHTKRLVQNDLATLLAKGVNSSRQLRPRLVCTGCKGRQHLNVLPILRRAHA